MHWTLLRPAPSDAIFLLVLYLSFLLNPAINARFVVFTTLILIWIVCVFISSVHVMSDQAVQFQLLAHTFMILLGLTGCFIALSWKEVDFYHFHKSLSCRLLHCRLPRHRRICRRYRDVPVGRPSERTVRRADRIRRLPAARRPWRHVSAQPRTRLDVSACGAFTLCHRRHAVFLARGDFLALRFRAALFYRAQPRQFGEGWRLSDHRDPRLRALS